MAAIIPSAIAKSKWLPSFGMSAGAKLTMTRLAGMARPEAVSAACTRSLDSATALSGKPTKMNRTCPLATCTCTSTGRASIPSNATVETRVTIYTPTLTLLRSPANTCLFARWCSRTLSTLRSNAHKPVIFD